MIVVVGESPGRGRSRTHLARMLDLSEEVMMTDVVWINIWDQPYSNERRYVEAIERMAEPGDAVLLLGRRVQRAFGLIHLAPLDTIARSGGLGPTFVAVPHPSGRNRWYNDPDHEEDARIVLRAIWRRHHR